MSLWSTGTANVKRPVFFHAGAKVGDPANTYMTNEGWALMRKDGKEEVIVSIGNLATNTLNAQVLSAEWGAPTVANAATGYIWLSFSHGLVVSNTNGNATVSLAVQNGTNLASVIATYRGIQSNPGVDNQGNGSGNNRLRFEFTAPNNANVTTALAVYTLAVNNLANNIVIVDNSLANLASNTINQAGNTAASLALAATANTLANNGANLVSQLQANTTSEANVNIILNAANVFTSAVFTYAASAAANPNVVAAQVTTLNTADQNAVNTITSLTGAVINSIVQLSIANGTSIVLNGMNITSTVGGTNATLLIANTVAITVAVAGNTEVVTV